MRSAVLLLLLAQAQIPDMLVSRQLLEREHLTVGAIVELSHDADGGDARRFRIAGVYEPLPDPMRFNQPRLEGRVHLSDVRAGTITSINVQLADPGAAGAFAAGVVRRLPGLTARATAAPDERASTFAVLDRFHLAIAIVAIAGSGGFLLALMVMLVEERRETMTTLRLIGFARARLMTEVLIEGGLIAAAGVVFGVALALAAQPGFNRFFGWRYDTALVFLRVTPGIVARATAIALPVGMLAGAAAGWTLLRHRTLTRIGR